MEELCTGTGASCRTVSLMEVDTGAIGRPPGGMVGMGMHHTAACTPRARGFTRTRSAHIRSMYIHAVTGRAITSLGPTGPAITENGIHNATTMGTTDTHPHCATLDHRLVRSQSDWHGP
jgi:hypothetical protein